MSVSVNTQRVHLLATKKIYVPDIRFPSARDNTPRNHEYIYPHTKLSATNGKIMIRTLTKSR